MNTSLHSPQSVQSAGLLNNVSCLYSSDCLALWELERKPDGSHSVFMLVNVLGVQLGKEVGSIGPESSDPQSNPE